MNPSARIWIYQCNRFLTETEESAIAKRLNDFAQSWTAHQQALKAEAFIKHKLFLVFVVDEDLNDASGCSIDKSVHLLRQLEQDFGIQVFDRFNLAYRDSEGKLQVCDRSAFEQAIAAGKIDQGTLVSNNLITTFQELETAWEIPFHQSWHASVFAIAAKS